MYDSCIKLRNTLKVVKWGVTEDGVCLSFHSDTSKKKKSLLQPEKIKSENPTMKSHSMIQNCWHFCFGPFRWTSQPGIYVCP